MSWWHATKRIALHLTKHTGRILFPYAWHYFTDDYKGRRHHLIVDTVLSLGVLGVLAANVGLGVWFYLFSIRPTVAATVSVPAVVISGASLGTTITFQPINTTITTVHLKLIGPSGYTFTDSTDWQWSRLSKGEQPTLIIPGTFTGNVNQQYRVVLLYTYNYFGQQFFDYTVAEFTVDTSSLEVVTTVPDKILNDESFSWDVAYHNSSDLPRSDVCVHLDIPDSFALQSSSLPIADGQVILNTLQPREQGTITITGSFKNAIGEGAHVLGVTGIDECSTQQYQQIVLTSAIQVLTPRLQVTTSGPSVLNVGDTGYYTVTYSNTGDTSLQNVRIVAQLTGLAGRYRAISISGGGTMSGGTMTWLTTALAPGETRRQTFSIATNPALREKNVASSYTVSGTADIADIGVATYAATAPGPITKFNSTLQFSQVARYTSTTGEQLGYGPYPLQAWNVTALRVFWQVEDFTNDLANVTLSTTLPSQVDWTGHSAVTEGDAMTYDPNTRRVTWHTSSIPSFSHAQGASFEVRVLPNSDQVGQRIHIINDTVFTARDGFTGVVLTRAAGAIATDQTIQPEE